MVEGAKRQKTPNEIALTIVLAGLTLVFLLVCVTLYPIAQLLRRHDRRADVGRPAGVPDSDDHRRAAGGDRHRRHGAAEPGQRDGHVGPRRRSGRRRRRAAAGQDRHDHARQSAGRRVSARRRASSSDELADAAQLASLADETPEGRSIVVLAKERFDFAAASWRRRRPSSSPSRLARA